MGEAWSDWYAMDYLADSHPARRSRASRHAGARTCWIGEYVSLGKVGPDAIRIQAIDCTVGQADAPTARRRAPGVPAGGYTYGELRQDRRFARRCTRTARSGPRRCGICAGRSARSPPGASSRARWSCRPTTRRSSTCATRSCRPTPRSTAAPPATAIWTVFAHRGMGYFAGTLDGNDIKPVASFSLPPAPTAPKGTVSGTVDRRRHARAGRGTPASACPASTRASPAIPARPRRPPAATAIPPPFATSIRTWSAGGAGLRAGLVRPFNLVAGASEAQLREPARLGARLCGGGRIDGVHRSRLHRLRLRPVGADRRLAGQRLGERPGQPDHREAAGQDQRPRHSPSIRARRAATPSPRPPRRRSRSPPRRTDGRSGPPPRAASPSPRPGT